MAILIENMEMPTEGYIDVRIKCNGTASFAIGKNPYFKEVEAVPVHEPHGRLIDASEAYDRIAEQEGGNYVDMDAVGMGLDGTPTVIPSSKEG